MTHALAVQVGEETAEQVRARRGTADETLLRIRQKFNLREDEVSDKEIFYLTCKYYYTDACADERVKGDYDAFINSGRTTMPDYVYRAGDPDVDYPHMHAF